jgi:hypothetical protein
MVHGMKEADPELVEQLVDLCRPILAGNPREVQGAVCANLLALWIAGHRMASDLEGVPVELADYREKLLTEAFQLVRDLIPFEDKGINERIDSAFTLKELKQ